MFFLLHNHIIKLSELSDTHSVDRYFYAEMGMFHSRSRRILQDTLPHRKSTQVRAVPERGNQGQTQHKGTAAGTAYAALVARRRSRRRPVSSPETTCHRSFVFLLPHKIDEKPCFALFFSKKPCFALFFPPLSPKLGLQNLLELGLLACSL
jgi:hypothetical protein